MAPLRALFVHAHFDDFEFTGLGTFEVWRRKLGADFRGKVLVCTDGKAGHHKLSREETGRVRLAEQLESMKIAQLEFEQLLLPNGSPPREACLQVDIPLLAALWKAIRDFEPDYLFCPPLPTDALVGIHVDHVAVAEAVRKVAYMINVPHAFTPEYPSDAEAVPCKVPTILNVHDGYMFGVKCFDLAVDVEEAFDVVVDASWCHQSQVTEWLPWVGRHGLSVPSSKEEWRERLVARYEKRKKQLGLPAEFKRAETFVVTAWGAVPPIGQLEADLPCLVTPSAVRDELAARLALWRGE